MKNYLKERPQYISPSVSENLTNECCRKKKTNWKGSIIQVQRMTTKFFLEWVSHKKSMLRHYNDRSYSNKENKPLRDRRSSCCSSPRVPTSRFYIWFWWCSFMQRYLRRSLFCFFWCINVSVILWRRLQIHFLFGRLWLL